MNPMYDFSTARSPGSPSPGNTPRHGSAKTKVGAAVLVVLVVAGGVLTYVRLTGDDKAAGPASAFCQTTLQLTQLMIELGAPAIGPIPDAVGAEAVKRVVATMGSSLGEFENSAPSKVRADVQRVVADLRSAAAGDLAGLRSADFAAAGTRISKVEQGTAGCRQAAGTQVEGD